MEIETRTIRGIVVVTPVGELDREGCDALAAALADATSSERPRIVVDLSRCTRISTDALRQFVALGSRLESRGGGFALCAARGDTARAIRVGGVARLCRVVPSVEEAVGTFVEDRRLDLLAGFVCELLARGEHRTHDGGQPT